MPDPSRQLPSLSTGEGEKEAMPTGVRRLRHRSWGSESKAGGTGTVIKQLSLIAKDKGHSTTNELLKRQA